MAYKQKHKYGYRDSLEKGNPEKVIYGQQFDDEFEALEQAIADIDPNSDGGVDIDEIEGLQEELDKKIDEAPGDAKQYARYKKDAVTDGEWQEIIIPDDVGIEEPDADGKPYARQVGVGDASGTWVEAATSEDIEDLDDRIDGINGLDADLSLEAGTFDGSVCCWDEDEKTWGSAGNNFGLVNGTELRLSTAVFHGSGAVGNLEGVSGGIAFAGQGFGGNALVEPVYEGKYASGEADDKVDLGRPANRWKDAYFSGVVDAKDFTYSNGTSLIDRIDAIEGNITGGGGFVEAPDDGSVYARDGLQPAWVKTYDADYIDAIEASYKDADAALQDQIDSLGTPDAYDDTQIKADLATETQARVDGDAALQGQIDSLENYDDTQITADLAAETQARIDGDAALQGDISDLESAIGQLTGQLAMGGSYDASTGKVITGNLPEFIAGNDLPDPASVPNTFVIVAVAGNNPEELNEGDWLVAGGSGWAAIKYGTAGTIEWDNIENVPDFATEQYVDDAISNIDLPDGGDSLWTDEGDGSISYSGDISVGGDAAFSGDVVTKDVLGRGIYRDAANGAGFRFSNNGCIFPTDGTGTQKTGEIDLGGTQYKFKDGYFSGSVSAGSVTANTLATNRETNGYFFKAEYGSTGTFSSFNHSAGNTLEIVPLGGLLKVNGTVSAGQAVLEGTVDATAFTTGAGNGTDGRAYFEIKGRNLWSDRFGVFFGSAGLVPTDNDSNKTTGETDFGSNVNRWKNGYFAKTVFAEDHIASSDERLKDNITTAPVGLIDSLKGREWDWKESGKKGSGVVAQELEQVLPHLVHTDDDGMKSVSYMGLCAYLIEEVKALRAEVEALK